MADLECDVAILGAGTAGITAERAARKQGATTRLIDPEFKGTTCAYAGCMPSKLLIAAANVAHEVRHAPTFGIEPGGVSVDGPAVMDRVRRYRDHFAGATRDGLMELDDEIRIKSRAHFIGPDTLQLEDGRTLSAKSVVIATGSFPAVPGPFGDLGDLVLTNQTVFELDQLPERLGVIGAGPLGLELAQAMGRLGVEVTVFELNDRLGYIPDPEVHDAYVEALRQDIRLVLGASPEPRRNGDAVTLRWDGDEIVVDRILSAAGRPPKLDTLGLEKSGLELDDDGVPHFDRFSMQCGDSNVFIAGDVTGTRAILHEASQEGTIAGQNAALYPERRRFKRSVSFQIAFTHPNLAQVGEIPEAADENVVVGCASYDSQGRATVEATNRGEVRIYADARDGRITGALMAGPKMEHMAHLLLWAITKKMSAPDILDMPFYHPTYEEGLKGAFRQISKKVSRPLPKGHGDADPPGSGPSCD